MVRYSCGDTFNPLVVFPLQRCLHSSDLEVQSVFDWNLTLRRTQSAVGLQCRLVKTGLVVPCRTSLLRDSASTGRGRLEMTSKHGYGWTILIRFCYPPKLPNNRRACLFMHAVICTIFHSLFILVVCFSLPTFCSLYSFYFCIGPVSSTSRNRTALHSGTCYNKATSLKEIMKARQLWPSSCRGHVCGRG